MSEAWKQDAREIHHEFVRRAQQRGRLMNDTEISRFLALAIAGEAGELANLIKKEWRGDVIALDAVEAEIADIRIYLEHMANLLGIDLDAACQRKLTVVQLRLEQQAADYAAEKGGAA